ncbi:hypothetical protein ACPXB5_11450 [Micromonospora arida]|uniref:hypothetical protein n=1 Tax=Micromonospora arida TaxID=2203715 RepID=UPI003CEF1928
MSVYAAIWDAPSIRIATDAEEVELIERAAGGDEAATLRLFGAYVPTLRNAISRYHRVLPIEDAQQAAVVGLLAALRAFDPAQSSRLASILRQEVAEALAQAAGDACGGFAVPERTLKRFFGILAKADGDPRRGMALAREYDMATDTFASIWEAVNARGSLDSALTDNPDAALAAVGAVFTDREISDVNDRMMCRTAFAAVTDLERDVCRLAYGFSDYDPQPDAEIGHRLGMGRVTTLRTRQRALGKMRVALGA